jgi:Extensin-like protein C-terminus
MDEGARSRSGVWIGVRRDCNDDKSGTHADAKRSLCVRTRASLQSMRLDHFSVSILDSIASASVSDLLNAFRAPRAIQLAHHDIPGSFSVNGSSAKRRPARPGAADHPPVDQSASQAESWSAAEIIGAFEECNLLLEPLGAAFDISKPIRTAQCGAAAAILMRRVAGVEIAPPTIVNCRGAAKLHEWIETRLQLLAQSVLGAGITRIISASGYSCRSRVGNTSG